MLFTSTMDAFEKKVKRHLLRDITKNNVHFVSLLLYFIKCGRVGDCCVFIRTNLLDSISIFQSKRCIHLTENSSLKKKMFGMVLFTGFFLVFQKQLLKDLFPLHFFFYIYERMIQSSLYQP